MKLCFFTMANRNPKYMSWAQRLLCSGDVVDRPLWFYRIPDNHPDPKRYRLDLLIGDKLPEADKYVYIDSDSLLIKHGDWESEDCIGAMRADWFKLRDVTAFRGEDDYKRFLDATAWMEKPVPVHSGCVVMPAGIKKEFAVTWLSWCYRVDRAVARPTHQRDQIHLRFAVEEFKLPYLPRRFHAVIKREEVRDEHVMIHASGHPKAVVLGERYDKYVDSLLGGRLENQKVNSKDNRWQVLTRLLMEHAEDSARPVYAEIGVAFGKNAEHLLRTFPGMKLHAVDIWDNDLDTTFAAWGKSKMERFYAKWSKVRERYSERVVEHKCLATQYNPGELLDGAFVDDNHITKRVIESINHTWPMIKKGGFLAGHDFGYKGTYYDRESVQRGVEAVFGKNYTLGPDRTWWVVKE